MCTQAYSWPDSVLIGLLKQAPSALVIKPATQRRHRSRLQHFTAGAEHPVHSPSSRSNSKSSRSSRSSRSSMSRSSRSGIKKIRRCKEKKKEQ